MKARTSAALVVVIALLAFFIAMPADAGQKPRPTHHPKPTATATATATPTAKPTPTPTATPTATPIATPQAGWTMVVNDQFDSGGLPSHWHSYDGPYGSGPGNCAIPAQSTVQSGYLDMHFSYLSSGSCGPGWYSAGLALSGFSSVDARVSVRFRIVDNGVSAHMIIPMRWPDDDASWPAAGEEDFCEDSVPTCSSYLHYGASNSQVTHSYSFDLTQWHTVVFERHNHVVVATVDGVVQWTYTGSETTLPSTMKHVVLQQECHSSCPAGTTGTEDIQIDWITVETPS